MDIKVSVIVPTCGRTELLKRCLAALCTQRFDKDRYEIIVVDDVGSIETKRVVDGIDHGVRCRYIPVVGRHGPAAARNAGIRVSRGEIIAFTDDDCIPRPDWLNAGVGVFVDGIAGASGKVEVPIPERPTDYEVNAARLQFSEFVTASCFYRKYALLKVGGFDERFETAWREDSDLFFRFLKGENRLAQAPDAVVVHPVRPAPWGISIRQQRKNMYNALLYKKHRDFYRKMLKPVFPWHYYLIVLALIASLTGVALGHPVSALTAFSVWLLATGIFCVRRLRGLSHSFTHIAEMIVTSVAIPPTCIFWRLVGAIRYRVLFF